MSQRRDPQMIQLRIGCQVAHLSVANVDASSYPAGMIIEDQSNPHPPSARVRASDVLSAVVDRIERNVADGSWRPGHRLPTERDLEREFGVTRNTLRKGLKKLEDAGIIVRHVGRGSFVAEPASASAAPTDLVGRAMDASPAEVMEIRLHLEPWASSLAATRATGADLAAIRDCLERSEVTANFADFERTDGELHRAIIGSAKNDLLGTLYEAIDTARQQAEWLKLKRRAATPERIAKYKVQHRLIVEALSDRNATLAGGLTRDHLLEVRLSLLGY